MSMLIGLYFVCFFVSLRDMFYKHYETIKSGVWDRNFLSIRYEESLFKMILFVSAFVGAFLVPFTLVKRVRSFF